ncbi:MAG: glycosyltransferase family 2 protein [Hydrogenophaga sp.]|uniref:glycosyltransferase family 2 protein n=1 Tax=Hydrogenophaga sp. TaxID=1904254 RepID=UPI0027313253|nr:glycosyltransferase family 2 protein [Hydrogenophaga sp.]MDP2407681.1 glycosyltransferase family 2 protein [Hydrogenophaga sp.]MDZ4175293.1 glycosyltransferase family 2 protein [Hydrogenophaga sp.]
MPIHTETALSTPAPADTPVQKLNELSEAVKDRDQQLVELLQDYTERNHQLVSAYQVIATQNQEILAQQSTVKEIRAHLDRSLQDIYRSSSWRITAPLRAISAAIQKLRRGTPAAPDLALAPSVEADGASPKVSADDRRNYLEWVRRYDTPDAAAMEVMRQQVAALKTLPRVSVVMPTYNANLVWLGEAIQSVKDQLYPHWELCIADDASTDSAVRSFLEQLAAEDARIKLVFRSTNGHISAATNSALDEATGDWITFLDHDDLLPPHALFYMVRSIEANPDARMLYSDEDKLDEKGRRFDPYFKCDWNPDLFYSHNLVTHLAFYRKDLIAQTGGLREAYAGAQDYDLVLRAIEHITPGQIVHVPFILYHWRAHAGSTATADLNIKPYAMLAGERALNDHFKRIGVRARAQFVGHGYRARYKLPDVPPLVSIIIPTRNMVHLVKVCIESIKAKTRYKNYEIILMDNGSDDPAALAYFAEQAQADNFRVIRDDSPFCYSAINNLGAREARGEILVFLNNDIEIITHEWLDELVSQACRPGIGAVGARLLYPNGMLQHAGIVLGIGGWAGHSHKGFSSLALGYVGRASLISSFSAVTGACLAVQKQHFMTVGGFDEVHLRVACNDVDLCLKFTEIGLRNIYTPFASLFHHESATRGYEDTPEKMARFQQEVRYMWSRWPALMARDPAYSPNLTLDHEDFGLAWPPRVAHAYAN